jgi:hypothetical protein
MIRRFLSTVAVLLAAFGLITAAALPASGATTDRLLTVWGSLHIEDYETWAANEHCYSSLNTTRIANTAYPVSLDWTRFCGGEIRAELHMQAQVVSDKRLHVYGSALFFEGTSETTSDLDGSYDFSVYVSPEKNVPLQFVVWNTAEGDCDCATYILSVGNYTP